AYGKVAVVFQDDPYGNGLQTVVRDEFTSGMISAFPYEIDPKDSLDARLKTLMGSVAMGAPDAILVVSGEASWTGSAPKAIAGQSSLSTVPVFLTDGSKDATTLFSDQNLPAIQTVLERTQGTAPGADPTKPVYGSFADSLRTKFNVVASDFSFLAHTYDA